MLYHQLANLVVFIHAAFTIFVIIGGFFVLRWTRVAYLHIPAAAWGILIEWTGGICPLTPLENALRARAGEEGYHGGFIAHYVLSALYPAGLTRRTQWILGGLLLLVNLIIYGTVIARAITVRRRRRRV